MKTARKYINNKNDFKYILRTWEYNFKPKKLITTMKHEYKQVALIISKNFLKKT
jgi:hypothetical protein